MRRPLSFALALLGLGDSLYLLWVYASPGHAMVCLGSGCDEVRASRFAHFAGLPTPLYGVAMYGLLALLIVAEPLVSSPSWIRRAIALIAGLGVAVSVALTAVEAWIVHAWCAWCVVQAVAIALIFILWLTLLRASVQPDRAALRRYATVLLVAIAAGAPVFLWLTRRHAEQAAQVAAPLPPASEIAARLVRPDSHITGNPEAPVTLVEFADLQCPSCAAAAPQMQQLRRRYSGRVRFVFRQFPLERIHAYALSAAEASECAAQQGKFWQALDRFYAANGKLDERSLQRYAGELGLDTAKFRACLTSDATLATVRRDLDDGLALGVRATPTFFLGKQRIIGAPEPAKFEQMLNQELAAAGTAPAVPSGAGAAPKTGAPPAHNGKTPPASAGIPGFGSGSFFNIQGNSTDCTVDPPQGPEPAMIHTVEAEKLFHDGSVFVDVRAPEDYRRARIAGARNLPLLEAERRAAELPRDRTIVLYENGSAGKANVCAASRSVGRVLLAHGYNKVVVYQDGLAGWQKQALPMDR